MKKNVYLFILLLIALWSCNAEKPPSYRFSQFYLECKNADGILTLNMPGWLIRTFIKDEDPEVQQLIGQIKRVKLAIGNDNEFPRYINASYQKMKKKSVYESILELKDGENSIEVSIRQKKNEIQDVIIAIKEINGKHIWINLRGSFTLNQLSNFIYKRNNTIFTSTR